MDDDDNNNNNNKKFSNFLKIRIYRAGWETWSLTMREKRRQRVFKNRVLRGIFG